MAAGPEPAGGLRPRGSATRRIWALVAVLLAVAGALVALALRLPAARPESPGLPLPLLAVLFCLAQRYCMELEDRRETRVVFLSEVPFVLGLAFAGPVVLLLARVAAPLVVGGLRRGAVIKPVFNAATAAVEVGVGLLVVRLLLGTRGLLDVRGWLVLCLATAVGSVVAAVLVDIVVALADGRGDAAPRFGATVRGAATTAAMTTTVGFVVARALLGAPGTAVPLAVCGAVLLAAYRSYSSLRTRYATLERLHRFGRVVGASAEVDGVVTGMLEQARDMLHAAAAEVVFVPGDLDSPVLRLRQAGSGTLVRDEPPAGAAERWLLQEVVGPQRAVLVPRETRRAGERALLDARGWSEVLAVPLRGDAGVVAVLLVADRRGQISGFGPEDVRLAETVASSAAAALRQGQLIGRLRHDARHDALTGLPNRVQLAEEAEAALRPPAPLDAAAGAPPVRAAVLLLDLDGFKAVNDTLGHAQGDVLLVEVAARLRDAVGDRGTVARLGGDEFAVLLPGGGHDDAVSVAGAVLRALEQPVDLGETTVDIAASVGAALSPQHGTDARALLKHADQAMYAAKSDRRGVLVWQPDLAGPSATGLAGQLRAALAAGEVLVEVQPQAELRTGRLLAVEVLARWTHPEHGAVPAGEFTALAERTGLLRPLTASVLDQALAAAARWRADGLDVRVSVNLSARSLLDDELERQVTRALAAHGLPGSALGLELPESSVLVDPARARAVLQRLRDRGIRLALDDFGAGYASLATLRALPVHEIKLDRSLVAGLAGEAPDRWLVRNLLALAADLGLDAVAEGVETLQVAGVLRELGCGAQQGWLLARPMPLADFPAWAAAHGPRLRVA